MAEPKSSRGAEMSVAELQQSKLKVGQAELDALDARGFVICGGKTFGSFVEAYVAVYEADLPLFISADSILHAFHRGFEEAISEVERALLVPELDTLLVALRAGLARGECSAFGDVACEDVDLLLSLALRLLRGGLPGDEEPDHDEVTGLPLTEPRAPRPDPIEPLRSSNAARFAQWLGYVASANRTEEGKYGERVFAKGPEVREVELFGELQQVDFSLTVPRGRYANTRETRGWFRSLSSLLLFGFRVLAQRAECATQSVSRRCLAGALALASLIEPERQRWERIADVLEAFFGPFDDLTARDFWSAKLDLSEDDASLVAQVISLKRGTRISGRPSARPPDGPTQTVPATFCFFGASYLLDAHVFSRLVYDRVAQGKAFRMMPSPLDIGYAVFGNEAALPALSEELARFPYRADLEEARRASADALTSSSTLCGRWLRALKALSASDLDLGEAWGRRLLGTQLASWAEMRHDSILYAKQSRTWGIICEYPDAWVEPCPTFFEEIAALCRAARVLFARFAGQALASRIDAYYAHFEVAAGKLLEISVQQRTGRALDAAQLAWINQAATLRPRGACQPLEADGWFAQLYLKPSDGMLPTPTIADVHTQDTDESGRTVGRVLHAATGYPRLMLLRVNDKLFSGAVSRFHEVVTDQYRRLDDEAWAEMLDTTVPSLPLWVRDLSVGDDLLSTRERWRLENEAKRSKRGPR